MKKVIILITVFLLAAGLAAANKVLAQAGPIIERSVSGSTGGALTGGNYILDGTSGESIAGEVELAGSYYLGSGFWAGNWAGDLTNRQVYLPLVVKSQ